jgi:hypothetical protein
MIELGAVGLVTVVKAGSGVNVETEQGCGSSILTGLSQDSSELLL